MRGAGRKRKRRQATASLESSSVISLAADLSPDGKMRGAACISAASGAGVDDVASDVGSGSGSRKHAAANEDEDAVSDEMLAMRLVSCAGCGVLPEEMGGPAGRKVK